MGYRSDSVAISRDIGPLSLRTNKETDWLDATSNGGQPKYTHNWLSVATRAAIYRSLRALRARNRLSKSQKGCFRGSADKGRKKTIN